jgi:hypothetical protein
MTPEFLDEINMKLNAGDFKGLFIGVLGWDHVAGGTVTYHSSESGSTLKAVPIAQKRGIPVYLCDSVPSSEAMTGLERLAGARTVERLMIYTDGTTQLWRWPETRRSGGTRYITHRHTFGSRHPDLLQRLAAASFTMQEEPSLTILTVRQRLQASFNADRVTARFYNEFQERQQSMCEDISGIPNAAKTSWYSSLLLNRLMFIYFMQRKGFLNDDLNYLRTSLTAIQALQGPDRFYEYYRDFLIPLFHHGLGEDEDGPQDPMIRQLIGDVPYVNGGIFSKHLLEREYDIHVPDSTFIEVFNFFDRFRWHLDERPTGDPEEINPEVLGYIFEQYVNQKAQGAYYTREDVTGYMAGMTIPSHVLECLEERLGRGPWDLLAKDPHRYIPEGLLVGFSIDSGDSQIPDQGIQSESLDVLAPVAFALPGERWRELLDRREFVDRLVAQLARGDVRDCPAAVSLNLDLQVLAIDWIASLAEEEQVFEAYQVLKSTRILDPTCGSGAFLFAALDLLEELYSVMLARAEVLAGKDRGATGGRLQEMLAEVADHASPGFFIRKTIVLENLYGLDIMPEAAEIARLRLFLALVAHLEKRNELEPLPDLDLNIRAGNALVGVGSVDELEERFGAQLVELSHDLVYLNERLSGLREASARMRDIYREFVDSQRSGESASIVGSLKTSLETSQRELSEALDLLFSPHRATKRLFVEWKNRYLPFHWFVEFPAAMVDGGFDVVIGNPPYVKKSSVAYTYTGFRSDNVKDICAPCTERATKLLRAGGWFALILPIAFQFSDDYAAARAAISKTLPQRWVSTYSRNPAALFAAGLGVRSTILVGRRSEVQETWTTDLRRWQEPGRPNLFGTNRYSQVTVAGEGGPWARTGSPALAELYTRLTGQGKAIGLAVRRSGPSLGFKQTALYYLSVFIDEPPAWTMKGKRTAQTKVGWLRFRDARERDLAFVLLAGRLAVWWWASTGDDFDVTSGLLQGFPVSIQDMEPVAKELLGLAKALRAEQPKQPIVTHYAGKEMGNYDMSRCRHITDESDQLVLSVLGLSAWWPDVQLADARLAKVTGERPGTRREWPFPWK